STPPQKAASDAAEYAVDAAQRWVLFWDAMRRAGNAFVEHERAGCPPVLVFEHEMLLDGRTLPRPCNYALVRIIPPADYPQTDPALRPFVIIDPRAGHGAGIGGFKSDSQVGVALRRRHPVYFVIFFRDPEPGQTILDITAAEREFLKVVHERHPQAPKPVVIGNCQGGWAVMMLGASEPELTGPLVLNGAPLSYWAGETGRNPMRYLGGLAGGAWPAALLADLGNGRFDGANLVLNFESLSPANTWFRKYYDLFANVDTEAERFLEFERWWGGYFLMNADEIRWIVENLFIGDRFAKGRLVAGQGAAFDMRAVKSPVIVFASAGDNITPPGQALRWIADVYKDEQEIKALGQTILYLVHQEIGHLGIFVSGSVARREHSEIATTLDVIEAVAPGLYELRITERESDAPGAPRQVELVERTIADIRALSGEASGQAFPAVAKISALNDHLYDVLLRPVVRQMATEMGAEARRALHPLRARRSLLSDQVNPFMAPFAAWARMVQERRAPAAPDNPFLAMERAWAGLVERQMDAMRDARDAWSEAAFHAVYGTLGALGIAGEAAEEPEAADHRELPAVREALARTRQGGYAEAVVRMMVLLAQSRGGVRRTRLERSQRLLTTEPPFAAMTQAERQAVIREQTVIVTLVAEEALAALPGLLPEREDRLRALDAVAHVAGPEEELGEAARAMMQRLRLVLGLG
ncbi:MAG TPA: DUF3141 domain-containing protein, partial [Acetobacteraceae bacterium]|nr:DUF3141 domain-containing protein [Acetobacteraceae bacterium]